MGISRDVYGSLVVNIHPGRLTSEELEKLSSEDGLELQSLDDIKVLDDGTLALKDRRVLLYIRDVKEFRDKEAQAPKFHLVNCQKLQQMRAEGRLERYVVAVKPDGRFAVNFLGVGFLRREILRLAVCQLCLEFLGLDGFQMKSPKASRLLIVSNFSIPSFFEKFPQSLHQYRPEFDNESAPLNEYGVAFRQVSLNAREKAGWRCQNSSCGVDLSKADHRRFLHAHHNNGLKWDNSESNLRILCLECHSEEPSHRHMMGDPLFSEFRKVKASLPQQSRTQRRP